MKRRSTFVAAVAVGAVIGSLGLVAPAYATPSYPSWDDVQQARQNEASAQSEIDRINGLLADLRTAAEDAGIRVMEAGEAYRVAQLEAEEAEQTLADLQGRLAEAEEAAAESLKQVGALVVRLQRSGSVDISASMLVGSDDPDETLYRLGALNRLSSRAAETLEQAQQDANRVDSLTSQADVASDALETARSDAEAKLAEAEAASTAANTAVEENQANQAELAARLAYLQDESLSVEAAYAAGVEASRPTAPPVQSPGGNGGGNSGGGSTTPPPSNGGGSTTPPPSNGGGTPAPNPTPPPTPTPPPAQSNAAQVAINFAYAQLGKPYSLGGTGPTYWDCSGLTMMSYRAAGIDIGYHSVGAHYRQMEAIGRLVPRSSGLKPGDLLFYSQGSVVNSRVMYHTTMYVGNGMMIEAQDYGIPVHVTPVRERNLVPYVGRPAG